MHTTKPNQSLCYRCQSAQRHDSTLYCQACHEILDTEAPARVAAALEVTRQIRDAAAQVQTPECDRMLAARVDTQPVGDFLAWASEQGFVLCKPNSAGRFWPCDHSTEQLLAEWQGIDLAEVEREKRAILDSLVKPR